MSDRLQVWFARFWFVWLGGLVALALWDTPVSWTRRWLSLFLPVEVWAAYRTSGGLGDTLSETMHFVAGLAGEDSRWYQSWKALVTGLVVAIVYQAAWAFGYGDAAWEHWPRSIIAAFTLGGYLTYHFLNPPRHG